MFYIFKKVSSQTAEVVIATSQARFQALGTANSPHVRLFDCLRAISGNQVLDGQELPCNNYGVKWQLATQEGICLLATPLCSVGSEVTDFSGKVHFSSTLKQVEARTDLFT